MKLVAVLRGRDALNRHLFVTGRRTVFKPNARATSQVVSPAPALNLARHTHGKTPSSWPLITMLARGVILLIEDVPASARPLSPNAPKSFPAVFRHSVQSRPASPAMFSGQSLYNPESRGFEFVPGPFRHVVLADENQPHPPRHAIRAS